MTSRGQVAVLVAVAAAVMASGGPALAQNAGAARPAPSPLDPVYACAGIEDAAARLACYDAAVAELRSREARRDVVAVDRAAMDQVRRESFGFNLPSLPNLFGRRQAETDAGAQTSSGRGPDATRPRVEEELEDRQSMRVAEVRYVGGRTTLSMENGQVWQFVETGEITPRRRPPFTVTIRRAVLGSFIMSVDGSNRGYRIRRVQ